MNAINLASPCINEIGSTLSSLGISLIVTNKIVSWVQRAAASSIKRPRNNLSWRLFRICYSPCSWFLSMTCTPTVFAIFVVYPSDCSLNSLSEAFGLIIHVDMETWINGLPFMHEDFILLWIRLSLLLICYVFDIAQCHSLVADTTLRWNVHLRIFRSLINLLSRHFEWMPTNFRRKGKLSSVSGMLTLSGSRSIVVYAISLILGSKTTNVIKTTSLCLIMKMSIPRKCIFSTRCDIILVTSQLCFSNHAIFQDYIQFLNMHRHLSYKRIHFWRYCHYHALETNNFTWIIW